MRKDAKNARRTRCAYSKCNRDPFLKNLGYYYKGIYYCNISHRIKAMEEQANEKHE